MSIGLAALESNEYSCQLRVSDFSAEEDLLTAILLSQTFAQFPEYECKTVDEKHKCGKSPEHGYNAVQFNPRDHAKTGTE